MSRAESPTAPGGDPEGRKADVRWYLLQEETEEPGA